MLSDALVAMMLFTLTTKLIPVVTLKIIISELFLADEVVLQCRLRKLIPKVKARIEENILESEFCQRILTNNIKTQQFINIDEFTTKEKVWVKSLKNLVTAKLMGVVTNINEVDFVDLKTNNEFNRLVDYLKTKNIKVVPICAKTEHEINSLSNIEK